MRNAAIIATLALLIVFAGGCTKTNPTVFSWYYLGNNYVADSAYSPATSPTANSLIIAYYAQTYILGFNTNKTLAVGTYDLGSRSAADFVFFFEPSEIFSQSGQLNITYNNGKSMSGNFNITFSDGSYMTGQFSDIPIR